MLRKVKVLKETDPTTTAVAKMFEWHDGAQNFLQIFLGGLYLGRKNFRPPLRLLQEVAYPKKKRPPPTYPDYGEGQFSPLSYLPSLPFKHVYFKARRI